MENILRGVSLVKQQGYNLCWAACLEMVLNYFNHQIDIKQCEIVARMYGLQTCDDVQDPTTKKYKPNFDQAVGADEIIKLGYAFGCYMEKETDENRYWITLKNQIEQGRPLIANIGFHYVVVVGFLENTEGGYFFYNDPRKETYCTKKFKKDGQITICDELLTVQSTI